MAIDPSTPPAVVAQDVTKRFRIPEEQMHTLKERALHPFRRSRYHTMDAVQDVSFAVPQGEFFGIVGRNGSGKTTLLKCLAGVLAVDTGRIYVNGRLGTFIELGVGFNPDLAARDNAILNGIMLGLTRREAEARVEAVIEFAELQGFVDLKLKNYSSGMMVRLAFAAMLQAEADILLIDEVLAVGDARFQQKCFDEFHRMRAEGRTMLFVTHDMSAVERFCDRAMLLEHGGMVMTGPPQEVGQRYYELNFAEPGPPGAPPAEAPAAPGGSLTDATPGGDGSATIQEIWVESEAGERVDHLAHGRTYVVKVHVRANAALEDPVFGLAVLDAQQHPVFAANSEVGPTGAGRFAPGEEVIVAFAFENYLAPGRYELVPAVTRGGSPGAWLDGRERSTSIVVSGMRDLGGAVNLPHSVELERVGRSAGASMSALPD
jgi:ABC-type polysaccharide/polyol phosphate transport system ATPase subunit